MSESIISTTPTPKFAPFQIHRASRYSRYDRDFLVGETTEGEFFTFDAWAKEKHQLIHGKVVRMPGSSPEHNVIQDDLGFEIKTALRMTGSPCDTISSDQKVYVTHQTIYYPDVIVFCGDPQFDHLNALRNPTVVVEILSPSTEKDDRTDKFYDYQKIESLRHYILVEQERVSVVHYERLDAGPWAIVGTHNAFSDSLSLRLHGAEISVPLSGIYRRVFAPDTDTPEA